MPWARVDALVMGASVKAQTMQSAIAMSTPGYIVSADAKCRLKACGY